MKLTTIDTGFFKLDGGAMFGVIPKSLWQKLENPDENNLCTWAMRCLLVETGNRKILIDAGIGNKQTDKFFSHYYLHGDNSLMGSIEKAGLHSSDITDVLLTHFHFDHAGGAIRYNKLGNPEPAFSNATYWSNQAHFDWAFTPNPREKASFLKENFVPLAEQGVLKMVEAQAYNQPADWMENIQLGFVYGHTEAMMLPKITVGDKTVLYCADLMPSPSHIGLPYVMGYDTRPLNTMQEKAWWLEQAVEQGWILFFEHAPHIEACTLCREDSGRIVADRQGTLSELLS